MDVKDPSIPVQVPSQSLAVFFLPLFPLQGLQARTESRPARIYENVFFILIKSIHTFNSCEMISC